MPLWCTIISWVTSDSCQKLSDIFSPGWFEIKELASDWNETLTSHTKQPPDADGGIKQRLWVDLKEKQKGKKCMMHSVRIFILHIWCSEMHI